VFSLVLLNSSFAFAQSEKIPPFRMLQTNGTIFKAEDLPMGKPIIIIYFSPECDHCTKMMKEFFQQASNFKKASVAMITYLPVEKVSRFEKEYSLNKYPNIHVGTEGTTFFVRDYYKVREMPFVALYTKKGDLIRSYSKEVALKDLASKLKDLN
jgi:thiol-disulfide isomerase/thioredoxin